MIYIHIYIHIYDIHTYIYTSKSHFCVAVSIHQKKLQFQIFGNASIYFEIFQWQK